MSSRGGNAKILQDFFENLRNLTSKTWMPQQFSRPSEWSWPWVHQLNPPDIYELKRNEKANGNAR